MSKECKTSGQRRRPTRRMILVLALTATYMFAEMLGGYFSNSLALMADSGHMFADVAALSISLFAFIISARPATSIATFGYHRAEIIAALFNGLALLLVCFFIIKEAVWRLFSPTEVDYQTMIIVAIGGLLVNVTALAILNRDRKNNINISGAWLHVLSDTLGSVGVVVSGVLIFLFDWQIADPVASIVIAILMAISAVNLILETLHVLMEHTPLHINPQRVSEEILSLPAALKVHDLHIWSITSGREALSVHVVAQDGADYDDLLADIQCMLERKFLIRHATIQIEKKCLVQDKTC